MYVIKTEKFEGPLDLLLNLIEEEKLDISEISLARVTDQYIEHLEKMESLNPGELADFLVVAAKLLWIKSKTLLPSLEVEEAGYDFTAQLRIYKEFRDASFVIHKMILKRRFTFTRTKIPLQTGEIFFKPPAWLTAEKLKRIFKEILNDLEPIVRLPRGIVEKTISIQEKIQDIRNLIRQNIEINFHSLTKKAKNKMEVIINFLAVLELLKHRLITVTQGKLFGDIKIKRGSHLP